MTVKVTYEPALYLEGKEGVFRISGILATSDQVFSVKKARELHAELTAALGAYENSESESSNILVGAYLQDAVYWSNVLRQRPSLSLMAYAYHQAALALHKAYTLTEIGTWERWWVYEAMQTLDDIRDTEFQG